MNSSYRLHLIAVVLVVYATTCASGESSKCLMVYKEGGAPAVLQSPKCPRWELSDYASRSMEKCQLAMRQGRRKYMEDRTMCALDIRIPFPGPAGLTEVTVGVLAVFDGHNGAEASEMASKLLLEYFLLHVHFLLDTTFSVLSERPIGMLPDRVEQTFVSKAVYWDALERVYDPGRFKLMLSAIYDGSFHLEILKESLLRAIHDIDTKFSEEALRNSIKAGSTAAVILMADDQIFVANVGDSKAFLCSETILSSPEAKAALRLYRQKRHDGALSSVKKYERLKLSGSNGVAHFSAKELTSDHHPDRDDERSRVESAGGHVLEWGGVSRVNGQLAVSRSIGDVSFKSYGVISAPEVTDWQPLSVNDSFLVAASDGIFEKLSPQDVCDLLWELDSHGIVRPEISSSCSHSLADCIVDLAFTKGSMDNLAAIVLPFASTQSLVKETCSGEGETNCSALSSQKFEYQKSGLEDDFPVMSKFGRLLVEGKHSTFGCFYLSENLGQNVDYKFGVQRVDKQDVYDGQQALPEALDHHCGGLLTLTNNQNLCMHFERTVDRDGDQCVNSEGFTSLLGLIGSIPMHDTGSDYFEHAIPDSRYILKRRFGRGAYGEVWLAVPWNCSESSNAPIKGVKKRTFSFNTINHDAYDRASGTNPYSQDCNVGPLNDKMFILKRIMVEKGSAVYLSGLREKYFGEVFLKASAFRGGSLSAGVPDSAVTVSQQDLYDPLEMKISDPHEINDTWDSQSMFANKKRLLSAADDEGLNHIARYVESFDSQSKEIWLVFRHEGVSLSKLLYTTEAEEVKDNADERTTEHSNRIQVVRPSKWWHWLKTTKAGQNEMRNLIRQLLMALKSCHDRNITHRDIKPENMVVCLEDQESGSCLKEIPRGDQNYTMRMRIIDFGSAMDKYTVKHLYGPVGPSRAEQTDEYTPPEAFLNASWYLGSTSRTLKYDMWSVGVVMLELILGSPRVFYLNPLTRALLDQHLDGWNEGLKELVYKLRSFMEMCILIPGRSSKHHLFCNTKDRGEVPPVPWKCSEEFFSDQIKSRDPLQMGFPNVWALRLVRQLLLWDPEDRLSVDDALQHPYFQHPPKR